MVAIAIAIAIARDIHHCDNQIISVVNVRHVLQVLASSLVKALSAQRNHLLAPQIRQ